MRKTILILSIIASLIGGDKLLTNPVSGADYSNNQLGSLKRMARVKNRTVEQILDNDNAISSRVWVNTKEMVNAFRFLSVVLPWRDGMSEPTAARTAKETIEITMPRTSKRNIYFGSDKSSIADIVVEVDAVREDCSNEVTLG